MEEDTEKEITLVTRVLKNCGYPDWALHHAVWPLPPERKKEVMERDSSRKGPQVTLPYISGLLEELRRVFRCYGCSTYFKSSNTLQQILCAPRDQAKKEEASEVVYWIDCEGTEEEKCNSFYMGKTRLTLKARTSEYWRPSTSSSEVSQHLHLKGRPPHQVSMDSIKILDREHLWFQRGLKKSVYIRMPHTDLNRAVGCHQLLRMWDNLLESHDLHRLHQHMHCNNTHIFGTSHVGHYHVSWI